MKYLRGIVIAFFLIFVVMLIGHWLKPISLEKSVDTSRVVRSSQHTWMYTQMNQTEKWRFDVNLSKIDPLYLKILIGFEDKRFWRHWGFDPLAMARAIGQLIKHGRIVSGGSTITMQLARLLEPKSRTVWSKIIEIFRAFELELFYTKKEILKAYLTLTPYGGNIEGIVAASLRYFGKLPYALNASEIAMLVALPQRPETYRPDRHPSRGKEARDKVLHIAKISHIISEHTYQRALKSALPTTLHSFPRYAPHMSQKMLKKYDTKTIDSTLNFTLQKQLEAWALNKEPMLPKGVTLSVLVVENNTSEIKAYLGSHHMFSTKVPGFIDMTQVYRSPGSTLKPFIYALGFEKHLIHPNTLIYDRQTLFGDYMPHNFSKTFSGEVTIAEALQRSLNIPAVKVLQKIGVQQFIRTITSLSGTLSIPKTKATLPVALGGLGISIWQNTQLYVALANGGRAKKLHVLQAKTDQLNIKTLFTARASKMTTAILRSIPPPRGYKNHAQGIAYKTGTSYGYRDFWTIAYTSEYTVAIWVGKPNNAVQLKHTARTVAAPLAFEVIDTLHAFSSLKPWSWEATYLGNTVPKGLAHFDKVLQKEYHAFHFIYPKKNAKYRSAGCHKASIELLIEGGEAPYYWYIDGTPKEIPTNKSTLKLDSGAHTLTAIDSKGETIRRDIWVFAPDCEE